MAGLTNERSGERVWNEEVAQRRAAEDGIGELGQEHWRVIEVLREHFIRYGAVPPERNLCHSSQLDPHCVRRLFRGSREAWHIAGVPAPGEETKTYAD